jgi:transcriptional regulator with XRE-family HTH domain
MIDRAELAGRIDETIRKTGAREAIAARTGIPLASLDRYCRGESDVPATRLGAIARACGVTTDFLVFGGSDPSKMTMSQQIVALDDDIVWIPLLDVIASAGPGVSNPYPFEIDRLPFPRRWLVQLGVPEEFVQFIPIHGDSMEPTVRDGSVALVDTRFQAPRIEAIYVIVDDDDVRLKRIGRGLAGSLTLISDNERYETDILSSIDAAKLKLAGRAFWAGGKI